MRWLQSFIDNQLPHVIVVPNNPVFKHELRTITGPKTTQQLKKVITSTLSILFVMAGVGWGLLLWNDFSTFRRADWTSDFTGSCLTIAGILAFLSVFVTITVDLYYVLITSNSIGQHVTSGEWDMLRLSPLGTQAILDGKYAATLIRVWRAMSIDFSFRVATVSFAILASVPLFVLLVSSIQSSWMYLSIVVLIIIFAVIPGTVLCILEPIWRMRAFVALGLMASAQIHNPLSAALAGLGYWMGIRLLQIAILLVILIVSALIFPLVVALPTIVMYIFYDVVLYNAMNRTLKLAFRSE
jgi:hypothetical protein